MANSSPQANNVKLKFRGKAERERQMPATSQAMARAMFSAKEGKSTIGVPKKAGEETGDVKALPKRKNKRADRLRDAGKISDAQHAKLTGNG